MKRFPIPVLFGIAIALLVSVPCHAFDPNEPLQGQIEENAALKNQKRIQREEEILPQQVAPVEPVYSPPDPHRIVRAPIIQTTNEDSASPVNLDDFHTPKIASAEFDKVMQMPQGTFDLGADRGSKELVLAWERWHKQFCQTTYYRTGRRTLPTGSIGSATAQITVKKDHQLSAVIVSKSGSPLIADAYLAALNSMYGNLGLTFPPGSERQEVTFTYFYAQGPLNRSGYDWMHNDYETVRQDD